MGGATDQVWEIADIVKMVEECQNAIDNDVDGERKIGAESRLPFCVPRHA
jgi:hypothetical protein